MSEMTSYDEKCLDLARHFYPNMDEKRLGELAALIQVTVEDFPPHTEEENGDAASGPRNGLTEHHSGCAVYDVTRPELGDCSCGVDA